MSWATWTHLAITSPLSYLLVFLMPAGDAIIPVLPGEAVVIAIGVATAGSTDPRIAVLVLLAAAGACTGDNVGYLIGRRFGWIAERRVFSGERGARRRDWAARALDRFGARLVVVCRFVPGGRTAVTLTCGIMGFRRRTFVAATVLAGLLWACYAYFLGRIGGRAFENQPWVGLLIAFAVGVAISALIEGARRLLARRAARAARAAATATGGREPTGDSERSEPRSRP